MRLFTITTMLLFIFCLPLIAQVDPNTQTVSEVLPKQTVITITNEQPTPTAPENQTITPELEAEITKAALEKAETYYSDRFSSLLWTMGAALVVIGLGMPLILERHRDKEFDRIMNKIKKQEENLTNLWADAGRQKGLLDHTRIQVENIVESTDLKTKQLLEKVTKDAKEQTSKQKDAIHDIHNAVYDDITTIYISLANTFNDTKNYASAFLIELAAIRTSIKNDLQSGLSLTDTLFERVNTCYFNLTTKDKTKEFLATVKIMLGNIKTATNKLTNPEAQKVILAKITIFEEKISVIKPEDTPQPNPE